MYPSSRQRIFLLEIVVFSASLVSARAAPPETSALNQGLRTPNTPYYLIHLNLVGR